MISRTAIIAFAATVLVGRGAAADESLYPLAVAGQWAAMAHKVSITAAPDVCVAFNPAQGVAFRADEDSVQLRVIDSRWSLPPNVTGTVSITIGTWSQSFEIDGNTLDSVNAEVVKDAIPDLFARIDKAPSMFVTVGKAKPFQVSLAGSTKATNAFLTCAGIKGHSQVPGSNPFE